MPATSPFHSKGQKVYHDNSKCGPGSEIPAHNRVAGSGGLSHCEDCAKQTAAEAKAAADAAKKRN